MAIAPTVKEYLDRHAVTYRLVSHPHAPSSMRTAEVAHVSGDRIAKAVLVGDEQGYLLAVLPATRRLQLAVLHHLIDRVLGLATESETTRVFHDCEPGAVPPLGTAYGVQTLLDEHLGREPEIYFEAGDHLSLVQVDRATFSGLLADARRLEFSTHV